MTNSKGRTSKSSSESLACSVLPTHQPFLRQGPQGDEMREHQNDHPETAAFLLWDNGTANQRTVTQADDVRAFYRRNNPGPGGPPNSWLRTLVDDLFVLRSTEDSTGDSPCKFGVETVPWVNVAKEAETWYRALFEAAERFMT